MSGIALSDARYFLKKIADAVAELGLDATQLFSPKKSGTCRRAGGVFSREPVGSLGAVGAPAGAREARASALVQVCARLAARSLRPCGRGRRLCRFLNHGPWREFSGLSSEIISLLMPQKTRAGSEREQTQDAKQQSKASSGASDRPRRSQRSTQTHASQDMISLAAGAPP